MHFALFEITLHYKAAIMKLSVLCSINLKNGRVSRCQTNNSNREIWACLSFFYCLGLGRTEEIDRLHMNPYDGSRVEYQDPITSFPTKMDELIFALNKVTYSKLMETIFFR